MREKALLSLIDECGRVCYRYENSNGERERGSLVSSACE